MSKMLQRSTILCLLISWAAAASSVTLSLPNNPNNTVFFGEELSVHWVPGDDDSKGGPGEDGPRGPSPDFNIALVYSSDPNQTPIAQAAVHNDDDGGDEVLHVPRLALEGQYNVIAFSGVLFQQQVLGSISVQVASSSDATQSPTLGDPGVSTSDTSTDSNTGILSSTTSTSSPADTSSFNSVITPSASVVPTQPASSTPANASDASGGASNTSKTPVIVGSIIGALIGTALIILAILVCLRRRKTKKETVQFYEQKMVRPTSPPSTAATDAPLTWEPLTLNQSDSLGRYPPTDVKRAFEPEPLPAYGYSNYDFIEKADYHDVARRSTLPGGAMPLPTTSHNIPKIFTTPATPSVSESSVLNGVSRSFGDVGSALRRDSFDGSPYGGIDGRT